MIGLILSAALVVSSNAFLQPRFAGNVIVRQDIALSAIKPDLFSGKSRRFFNLFFKQKK
jgi:hypothetical protein